MGKVKRTKAEQQIHDATWVLVIAGMFPCSILVFSVYKNIGSVNWWWFWTTLMPRVFTILFTLALAVTAIFDAWHWVIERIREYYRKSIYRNS